MSFGGGDYLKISKHHTKQINPIISGYLNNFVSDFFVWW